MAHELQTIPGFDDIVFEIRNKDYGAYILRKSYNRNVLISLMFGIILVSTAIIVPYLNAKVLHTRVDESERKVEIKMQNLDQPTEKVAPPPELPPPADMVQQVKYVPPVVVDSVNAEETVQLMTADQAQAEVTNKEVLEIVPEAKPEIQEVESEPAPFIVVEEMPMPLGGIEGLMKFIAENTKYPEVARENNIEGKVFVKFCVTSKGGVDQVSISKGVDPELDAEAMRVVRLLPTFKPGKQGGRAVPVWYTVPIIFQIKQ